MLLVDNYKTYGDFLINCDKKVIIDFYADWCGPCKKLTPHLEQYEENNKDIIFLKVNIDNEDCSKLVKLYNISSLPTIIFIKDKIQIDNLRITGFNLELLEENIKKFE